MRPRHALAAAAILTAVTLGSWAALVADDRKPAPQAAEPNPTPVTSTPAAPTTTKPHLPEVPRPRPCLDGQAGLLRRPGRITTIAGDFDGDHARDRLLAYTELDAARQPRQWHIRVVLATGDIADLALDNTPEWIGPNGLVARRAVDANGDGRDEGFVTSTGGASNDAYNLFVLDGCQLRQVEVAGGGGLLRFAVGASLGHAEGFDCQDTDRHGRRLLTLWSIERTDQQPDGSSAYTYSKTSYRWVGKTLVRQVDTDRGGFGTVADGLPMPTSQEGHDQLPAEFTTRCGGGTW